MKVDIDPKIDIITDYAIKYQHKLKQEINDPNEIERKLNEWIKDALKYVEENPNITEMQLIDKLESGESKLDL